jgi:predicted amidohydrolase
MKIPPRLVDNLKNALEAQPAWAPNLFGALYDVLGVHARGLQPERRTKAESLFLREHLQALRDAQRTKLGSVTPLFVDALQALLAGLQKEPPDPQAVAIGLYAALTLDRLFDGLNQEEADDHLPYLAHYRRYLIEHGTLFDPPTADGVLIARAAPASAAAREVADLFSQLIRVPLETGYALEFRTIDRGYSARKRGDALRVGFVPVAHTPKQLDWPHTEDHYTCSLLPGEEAAIWGTLEETLNWVRRHDVFAVVLPELVSSESLLQRISRWRAGIHHPLPQLIVAGSYLCDDPHLPGKPRNRAVMLDSSGVRLWTQDKMHPYVFTVEHQELAEHVLCTPARNLEENIGTAPRLLQVRDFYPGRFRCAIAICEDFARVQPYHPAMRSLAATHLFIPIMNPARTGGSDWIKRYGISLAQEGHTISVVANSGVLVRAGSGSSAVNLRDSKHYCDMIGPAHKRYPVSQISENINKSTGYVDAVVLEMRPDPHS